PDNSAAAQISLISNPIKSRAPFILSKAAVEKIRVKFGQVQAHANSGALILTKTLKYNGNKSGNNSKPATQQQHHQKAVTVEAAAAVTPTSPTQATPKPKPMPAPMPVPIPMPAPMPAPMPMPMPMPAKANVIMPELKISPMPAVNLNGAKIMKVPGGALAVVVPTAITTPAVPLAVSTKTTASGKQQQQQGSPKLQRSKSLAGGSAEDADVVCIQSNSPERRHSVAIMSKEVDVVETPKAIETITIDDDDSEEEKEPEPVQQQKPPQQQHQQLPQPQVRERTPSGQNSRKNSTTSRSSITSSSSDLEIITPLTLNSPKQQQSQQPQQQPQQQQQLPQKQEQLSTKEQPGVVKLSILKAESVSKEDFEKSLLCNEPTLQTSPSSSSTCSSTKSSSGTSASITVKPLSRLQRKGLELQAAAVSLSNFKRNMQSNFGMLRWRDQQPGTLASSTMRFELNRFNLLQLAERCETRHGPASYFERALFDRPGRRPNSSSHPLLYLCSRCNCHGPASDFLAPRFCSLCCVRRAHKRRQPNVAHGNASENNISRTQDAKVSNGYTQQLQKQQREKERNREQERERERKSNQASRPFRWTEYLKIKGNGNAAPIHLFLNPFPITPNCFERGMKLEAIDPENCSLFCVCTIVEVRGYRLKLNFDGYSSMYDFWVNADSMDIFPPGWCERTSHVLQAPKGYCPDRFTWYRYLVKTNAKAAPCALFTHLNGPSQTHINGFTVGMHLEAEDLNDTGKICVATVADILDERIRVHFDGWNDCYDFWVHVNSPYIHPCGWHEGRQQLIVPPDYENLSFNWADYIADVGGIAAPVELFAPREPMEFQPRMKLEVVDQRNPCLIRPATVITRKGYRVQLHLDCWPAEYYFWLEDDSPDLHPIGWCEATSHELETPPGFLQRPSPMPCDVEGCRGFGNAKRFNLNVHALRDCCPYAPENWRQWRSKTVKPPRVPSEQIKRPQSPKPQTVKEAAPLLLSRLSNNKSNAEKVKTQAEKVKPSSKTESKPKVKREVVKPAPLKVKTEPKLKYEATPVVNQVSLSIAKSIVSEYGPQFARNYNLWQRNSDFDMAELKSNPIYWTNWDVYEFVERALKSSSIAQVLFDEEIDGRALLMMGRKDLDTYLKLKVGPTVKLFSLIVNLRIAVASKFETNTTGLNLN
ncbi:hypothetical protein KR222_005580, partial [Zaprionus bogoriensis]